MGKESRDTRVSTWRGKNSPEERDLYVYNGERVEFWELNKEKQKAVVKAKDSISNALWKKLQSKTTTQVIDDGVEIQVSYSRKGVEHFCNDAMVRLSGKYFSAKSMLKIDDIFARSTYIPTSHEKNSSEN